MMRLKRAVSLWLEKLIYIWLIFWVGGLGALTYFDGFLPNHPHHHHPYHLGFLVEPPQVYNPLPPPPELLAQQMSLWLLSRFLPEADFIIAQHLASGLAQFFGSGLSDGYLLTTARGRIFMTAPLIGSVLTVALSGRSVWLAPPEKPPSSI
jgi:hypothetical protein